MTINEKISVLRRNLGMSQDELAEKLDVSRQSVSKWESGKSLPETDKVLALSKLFNVSADFLLDDEEEFATVVAPSDAEIIIEETEDDIQDEPGYIEEAEYEDVPTDEVLPVCEPENAVEVLPAPADENKKKTLPVKKIIAAIVAVVLIVALIIPIPTGLYEKTFCEEYIEYPYVLVHGLGGYGADSKINDVNPYWGAETGNLAAYLKDEMGYEVYEASVGPFSSTWDRTCELYAQLMGTTVDYGEAHSQAHGHERYGRTYESKLAGEWGSETKGGQVLKVNLVGHSFGGATIRMLASLLEYGDEAEKQTSGDEVSPLFKGGQGNLVNSVTTLCSPHNGSTLYYCVEKYNVVDYALNFVFFGSQLIKDNEAGSVYDFHLEHFGIESGSQSITSLLNTEFGQGTDNAAYDLSPDGAAEINKNIKLVDSVYYFSYAYTATTQRGSKHYPDSSVLSWSDILYLPAGLIGSFSNNTVTDYPIDETWLENDGMVNVISAKYPFGDEWQDYDSENIVKGVWNVMPVEKGHHGTVIGMGSTAGKTQEFYLGLFKMIDERPRDKKYYFKGLF